MSTQTLIIPDEAIFRYDGTQAFQLQDHVLQYLRLLQAEQGFDLIIHPSGKLSKSAREIFRALMKSEHIPFRFQAELKIHEYNFDALSQIATAYTPDAREDADAVIGFRYSDDVDHVCKNWADIYRVLAMPDRVAEVNRTTSETAIKIRINLDGTGQSDISTGIGFFDHMLEQIARHGNIDLQLSCTGDLHIDEHHTIEDVALALGAAFHEALGDKKGLQRYGFMFYRWMRRKQTLHWTFLGVIGLFGRRSSSAKWWAKCRLRCSSISLSH